MTQADSDPSEEYSLLSHDNSFSALNGSQRIKIHISLYNQT